MKSDIQRTSKSKGQREGLGPLLYVFPFHLLLLALFDGNLTSTPTSPDPLLAVCPHPLHFFLLVWCGNDEWGRRI